jgi:putative tryptophan/tyrosine transport system substrate-binding protein
MRRRAFIAGLGGAAAWPLVARAQQSGQVRRVGFVMAGAENDPEQAKQVFAFREGMRKLGWVEGKNLVLEGRWQAAGAERAQAVISELINLPLDVILVGTLQAFLALRRSSSTIPVVFVNLPDPVATGLVNTIAKTNSNFTGFTAYEYSITGKWLQVLKEIAPDVNRVGFIFGTTTAPVGDNFYRSLETQAPSFGVTTLPIRFSDASGLDTELKAFAPGPKAGLLIAAEGATFANRAKIISFAADHRLPAIYPFRNVVAEGGLAFYGIDFVDLFARAPSYVDQILRGANPVSLPIQAPTKFELVINLKAAKQLGIDVPPSLLARADEVIE